MSAHSTDWAALGLPSDHGKTAFTAVPPRGATTKPCTAPKKRGLRTAIEKTLHALRDNTSKSIVIASQADADRNARIKKGRAL